MKFSWNSLQLWVGEMSRARALQFSRDAGQINLVLDPDDLAQEVDFLIVSHAPCQVVHAGTPLPNGTHDIELEDGFHISLTLPITRECFNALPASLALAWAEAATAENKITTDFFLLALQRVTLKLNEPASGNGQF